MDAGDLHWQSGLMSFTLVSVHAHPDDEALLTGGTLARAAAEGHRVVLVTATDGAAGLTAPAMRDQLGTRRLAELENAAAQLGCQRVVPLGYADGSFAAVDPLKAAARLVKILDEEAADAVTIYDPAGGYGHADHVHVHTVGVAAAQRAQTPVVLAATVDRERLLKAVRILQFVPRVVRVKPANFAASYTPHDEITHCVDVRRFLGAKQRALAAHRSQTVGNGGGRTVALLAGLPALLTAPVLGHEWFVELGRTPDAKPLDDIFASLR